VFDFHHEFKVLKINVYFMSNLSIPPKKPIFGSCLSWFGVLSEKEMKKPEKRVGGQNGSNWRA